MENRIKEVEKQIEFYKKKILKAHEKFEKSHEKFEKAKEKHNKEIEDITHELWPLTEERNALIVEQWVERGKQGLNNGLYESHNFDKLPTAVIGEYYKIRDWYYGCRGCTHNYELEAEAKFKEMFGF